VRRLFDGVHAQRRGLLLLLAVVVTLSVVALRRLPTSIFPKWLSRG